MKHSDEGEMTFAAIVIDGMCCFSIFMKGSYMLNGEKMSSSYMLYKQIELYNKKKASVRLVPDWGVKPPIFSVLDDEKGVLMKELKEKSSNVRKDVSCKICTCIDDLIEFTNDWDLTDREIAIITEYEEDRVLGDLSWGKREIALKYMKDLIDILAAQDKRKEEAIRRLEEHHEEDCTEWI